VADERSDDLLDCTGYIRGREGRVVFIEGAQRYLIVSLEWVGETKEGK
jgi:hypothetical protein